VPAARAGLIAPLKRRRRPIDQQSPFAAVAAANDEWSADFKGWFRTADGRRIDPLTMTDSHSRFLIDVAIVPPTIDGVRPVFAAAFRDHGLPLAIRCDTQFPFPRFGPWPRFRMADTRKKTFRHRCGIICRSSISDSRLC
jgi:hypothetical protein